jgi:hypothetical protein
MKNAKVTAALSAEREKNAKIKALLTAAQKKIRLLTEENGRLKEKKCDHCGK